jgi:hypothetical protein
MPQVKIGHLRSIPAPCDSNLVPTLADLGSIWSKRNGGIVAEEQGRLDEMVAGGLGLASDDLARMRRDSEAWS